jgi:hypothetical protein
MLTSSPEFRVAHGRRETVLRWLFAYGAAALVLFSGIKRFEPWDQVLILWEADVSPLLLAVTGHPHFFRFLTAYPGFLWGESSPDFGFSLYISIFFAFNVVLWRKLALVAAGRAPGFVAWVGFLGAHFFMNGRGVIAWTAWLICSLICVQISRGSANGVRQMALATLACWLAAVSTGVFVVVVVAFVVFKIQYRRPAPGHPLRKMLLICVSVPLLFYIAQYLLLSIQKNIDFFGGGLDGVFHMLEHGFGRVLFGSELVAILAVAGAAFTLLFGGMLIKIREKPFSPVERLLWFAAGGGLFGLTVLTLAVPLALLYPAVLRAVDERATPMPDMST